MSHRIHIKNGMKIYWLETKSWTFTWTPCLGKIEVYSRRFEDKNPPDLGHFVPILNYILVLESAESL